VDTFHDDDENIVAELQIIYGRRKLLSNFLYNTMHGIYKSVYKHV